MGFTEVTSALYYSDGSLGTLKIPSIGLTVGVYEGTGSAPLLKGAGHFEGTSIWSGNVAIAGHNRGVRNDFGKIHTLKTGDTITFTGALGTRSYAVTSVSTTPPAWAPPRKTASRCIRAWKTSPPSAGASGPWSGKHPHHALFGESVRLRPPVVVVLRLRNQNTTG